MKILKQIISCILFLAFGLSTVFNILFLFGKIDKTLLYMGIVILIFVAFLISILGFIIKRIRKEQYVKINIITSIKEFGIIFTVMIIAWVVSYFLVFFSYSEDIYAKDGSKIMHNQSEFYDLDFDGIPEIITNIYAEIKINNPAIQYKLVYKLYEESYEMIGVLDSGENLYINPDNKIVSVKENSTQILKIENKTIIYSPYIDSTGSDSYNGIKYDEIGYNSDFFVFENYHDYINREIFLADLSRISRLEYSDVLNALKSNRMEKVK